MLDKRAMYDRFKASLPASEQHDRYFKIFYSDVRPSPLVIVGLNPGGDPDNPGSLQSKSTLYEHGEHDYVDCDYPIAVKMRGLLLETGAATDLEAIRSIPKVNVVFHRSARWEELTNPSDACELSRVHVSSILLTVSPRIVLVEGFESLKQLVKQQALTVTEPQTLIPSRLKTAILGFPDGRVVKAVVLGHPTGARWSTAEWRNAVTLIRAELSDGQAAGSRASANSGPRARRRVKPVVLRAPRRSWLVSRRAATSNRAAPRSLRRTVLLGIALAALAVAYASRS